MSRYFLLFIIGASILLSGCTAITEMHWSDATKQNNVYGYKRFLRKYPNSEYSELAKTRIAEFERKHWEKLESAKALGKESIWNYRLFLKNYPGSQYSTNARERIAALPIEDWKKALEIDNSVKYDNYQRDYPRSKYAAEARAKRDSLIENGAVALISRWDKVYHANFYWGVRTTFSEVGGKVGYQVSSKRFYIKCGASIRWGFNGKTVHVKANGSTTSESSLRYREGDLTGCYYQVDWEGTDDLGNNILIEERSDPFD